MTVRLKICGITRPDDLAVCEDLGVDAVGINLWHGSKRGLSLAQAGRLLAAKRVQCERVGVFVDATPDDVAAAARDLGLDAIQWHGDGPVEPYAALGVPLVWVVRGTPDLDRLHPPKPDPRWVLLDAAVAGYGGAGVTTDWAWAAQAVRKLAPLPVWLAGGITPANAADAVTAVDPAGLDVASGAEPAEAARGHKDATKVAALLAACRGGVG